jgi:hypothetical protein
MGCSVLPKPRVIENGKLDPRLSRLLWPVLGPCLMIDLADLPAKLPSSSRHVGIVVDEVVRGAVAAIHINAVASVGGNEGD